MFIILYCCYSMIPKIIQVLEFENIMVRFEIYVYWVVSYELCNHTTVRPIKGDKFCDGFQNGNPTSLIT